MTLGPLHEQPAQQFTGRPARRRPQRRPPRYQGTQIDLSTSNEVVTPHVTHSASASSNKTLETIPVITQLTSTSTSDLPPHTQDTSSMPSRIIPAPKSKKAKTYNPQKRWEYYLQSKARE